MENTIEKNAYQQGVEKALKQAGESHANDAINQGIDPSDIVNHPVMQPAMSLSSGGVGDVNGNKIDDNSLNILKNLIANNNPQDNSSSDNNKDISDTIPKEQQIRDNILNQLLETTKQKGFFGKLQQNIAKTNGDVTDADTIKNLFYAQKVLDPGTAASTIASMKENEKKTNALAIADAIESGDQLADFKSLYGLAGPVKAELSKRGVNVAKLQLQATAETKLAQTLNGPQQVRLKQSINSVMGGLDELDNLNQEFQRSGIKGFNKGQLEFLANGGGTPEQQALAQRFKTQIIGIQDEFGNVVMGGNSPTDRALELSGKIFSSDFNNTSISAATKQMRRLLAMRKSAIDNVGEANSGKNNQQSNLPVTENKSTGFKILRVH